MLRGQNSHIDARNHLCYALPMKCAFMILFSLLFVASSSLQAHPGRTASDGCHYCRTNCDKWGEIAGQRHCHNSTKEAKYSFDGGSSTGNARGGNGRRGRWSDRWNEKTNSLSWPSAKNKMSDKIYYDHQKTFYCDWSYTSDNDSDGSGCLGIVKECPKGEKARIDRIEWEHVVPKSYFQKYAKKGTPRYKKMKTDLHNLVPAVGEVNQYRSNGFYGVIQPQAEVTKWKGCKGVFDTGGASCGPQHIFEPADRSKPMAARITLYIYEKYEMELSSDQTKMLVEWCKIAKPTDWEEKRNARIKALQGDNNTFVTAGCEH